jgi:hypothetical protein
MTRGFVALVAPVALFHPAYARAHARARDGGVKLSHQTHQSHGGVAA